MEISRETLYQHVWTKKQSKVASELEISVNELTKACRNSGIPMPPAGHWSKVRHGHAIERTPLSGSKKKIVVLGQEVEESPISTDATVADSVPIEIASVSASTKAELQKAPPDLHGIIRSGSSEHFACQISPASVERAASILDTLERAFPRCGISIIKDQERKRITLHVDGEHLMLTMSERVFQCAELGAGPSPAYRNSNVSKYTFTGELRIILEGDFQVRRVWSDGIGFRLEDKMNELTFSICRTAIEIGERRRLTETQMESGILEKWYKLENDKRRRDEDFLHRLFVEAEGWHRFKAAQDYVEFLERDILVNVGGISPFGADWLQLAKDLLEDSDLGQKRLMRLTGESTTCEGQSPYDESPL